jgi:hypothetical protein
MEKLVSGDFNGDFRSIVGRRKKVVSNSGTVRRRERGRSSSPMLLAYNLSFCCPRRPQRPSVIPLQLRRLLTSCYSVELT